MSSNACLKYNTINDFCSTSIHQILLLDITSILYSNLLQLQEN